MKTLKSIVATLFIGATLLSLTACSTPEGMRPEFYQAAKEVFIEIDDDTLELEMPDQDDIANYQAVVADAESDLEKKVAENLEILVSYNPSVIKPEATQEDFKPYVQARKNIAKLLQLGNELPPFKVEENQAKN